MIDRLLPRRVFPALLASFVVRLVAGDTYMVDAKAKGETSPVLVILPPAEYDAGDLDSLPLSLLIRVADGVCEKLLNRGDKLPTRSSKLFTTTQDDQNSVCLELYIGERPFCDGNKFLGSMTLDSLPIPSYRSFVQIEVGVSVDKVGKVVCHAFDVEGRALGETYAQNTWSGHLLETSEELPPQSNREMREVAVFSHVLAKHLPVLLATRTVRLYGGADILIQQHRRRKEENVGTGGVLWESAIVLADYVGRNAARLEWRGKRVLELGAGTGLVAIALALEGAEVVATDGNPRVLEGAQRNVDGASKLFQSVTDVGSVQVQQFDWNSAADLAQIRSQGHWDVILGSDLVYPGNAGRHCVASNATDVPPADEVLLSLLAKFCDVDADGRQDVQVLLALKDRTGEVARFVALAETRGWRVETVPREEILPEFQAVLAVVVVRLWKAM